MAFLHYSAGDITVDEVSGHPSIDLSSLEGDIELLLPSDAFRSEKRNETKRNETPPLFLCFVFLSLSVAFFVKTEQTHDQPCQDGRRLYTHF